MNETTGYTIVGVAAAAALASLFYFVSDGTRVAHEEGTKRIEACVQAGGTWLDQYSVCVNNGKE